MSQLSQQELLEAIRKAKSSHIRWRSYAQALVDGVDLGDGRAPVSHLDCRFGRWYYGDGREQLGHLSDFQEIEEPHEKLHTTYAQIDALVADGKLIEARELLDELVGISRSLLEKIERLEEDVKRLHD